MPDNLEHIADRMIIIFIIGLMEQEILLSATRARNGSRKRIIRE